MRPPGVSETKMKRALAGRPPCLPAAEPAASACWLVPFCPAQSSPSVFTLLCAVVTTLQPDTNFREIGRLAVWSVTSAKPGNGVELLRDGRDDTYWQSDGAQPHLVNVQFQKKVGRIAGCCAWGWAGQRTEDGHGMVRRSCRWNARGACLPALTSHSHAAAVCVPPSCGPLHHLAVYPPASVPQCTALSATCTAGVPQRGGHLHRLQAG